MTEIKPDFKSGFFFEMYKNHFHAHNIIDLTNYIETPFTLAVIKYHGSFFRYCGIMFHIQLEIPILFFRPLGIIKMAELI